MELEDIGKAQSVNEEKSLIQKVKDEKDKVKKEVNELRKGKPYSIKNQSKINADINAFVSNVNNLDFDINSTKSSDLLKNSCSNTKISITAKNNTENIMINNNNPVNFKNNRVIDDSEQDIIFKKSELAKSKKLNIKRKQQQKELAYDYNKRVGYLSVKNKESISLNYSCKQNTNYIKKIRNENEKSSKSSKFFPRDKKTKNLFENVREMKTTKEKNFQINNTNYLKSLTQTKNLTKILNDNDELRRQKKSGTLMIQTTKSLLGDLTDPRVFELAKNM